MDPWRTGIVESRDGHIRIRGYDVPSLMTGRTFTDTIFLLHQNRLPTPTERALLDAVLTGVADHGSGAPSCAAARLAASGNRQSVSAAVAAGILAIGDDHGGAGSGCMEMIAAGVTRARAESLPLDETARLMAMEARASGKRFAGFGHRPLYRCEPTPGIGSSQPAPRGGLHSPTARHPTCRRGCAHPRSRRAPRRGCRTHEPSRPNEPGRGLGPPTDRKRPPRDCPRAGDPRRS